LKEVRDIKKTADQVKNLTKFLKWTSRRLS
jgi:hypothetical protein